MSYQPLGIKELHDKYQVGLTNFATSIIKDREVARDMVADFFIALLTSTPEFDSEASEKAFCYVAIRNDCYDYLRHEKAISNYEKFILAQPVHIHDLTEEEEAQMDWEEQMRLIYAAVEKLPKRKRAVVKAVLAGQSVEEIADLLKISCKRVRNHKAEAWELLREKLQPPTRDLPILKGLLLVSLPYLPTIIKAIWTALEHTVR